MILQAFEQYVPANIHEALVDKRLIFTIAAEQSDSNALTRSLSVVPNIVCQQDTKPSFAHVRPQLKQGQACVQDFWVSHKLPHIAACASPIYIETSHLFGKGFMESLVDIGFVPDLIILTHPIRETAVRLYQSGLIPGRTEAGCTDLLTPDDNDVMPLVGWRKLHDYQLCYWYCLEMARRSQKYAKLCRSLGGRVVATTLDELETISGFRRFVTALDLPWLNLQQWFRFAWLRRERLQTGSHMAIPDHVEQMEERVIHNLGMAV